MTNPERAIQPLDCPQDAKPSINSSFHLPQQRIHILGGLSLPIPQSEQDDLAGMLYPLLLDLSALHHRDMQCKVIASTYCPQLISRSAGEVDFESWRFF